MQSFVSLTFYLFLFFFNICPSQVLNIHNDQCDLIILPDTLEQESLAFLGKPLLNLNQAKRLRNLLEFQVGPILVELSIWKRFFKEFVNALNKLNFLLEYEFYQFNNYILCIPLKKEQLNLIKYDIFNFKAGTLINSPTNYQTTYLDTLRSLAKVTLEHVYVYMDQPVLNVLKKIIKPNPYKWNIVIFGHGGRLDNCFSIGTFIAGIHSNEFKALLKFFNTEIRTNILLYSTCYGGSTANLGIYKTNNKDDVYNFPIIIKGITETIGISFDLSEKRDVFNSFFKTIHEVPIQKEKIDQIGLAAGIMMNTFRFNEEKKVYEVTNPNNIIQIRWPGKTHFEVVNVKNLISSSHKQEDCKKEKNIIDAIRITSQSFIIDKPFLNKNFILSNSDYIIASSTPYKWHYIKGIALTLEKETVHDAISRLLSYLTRTINLESSKVFLIDTVNNIYDPNIAKQVILFINSSTPSLYFFQKANEAFYMLDQEPYIIHLGQPEKLSPKLAKSYIELFNTQKEILLKQYFKKNN